MIQHSVVIFVTITYVLSDLHFNYCLIGSPEKCLGNTMNMLDLGTPNSDAGFILSTNKIDYDSCAELCTWNGQCYMALFRTDTHMCQLYKKISYKHTTSPLTKLYLWTCCNSNVSYNAPNRCPGFWKLRPQFKTDNMLRLSDPLVELKGVSSYQCQIECLDNPLCGALNYFRQDDIDVNVVDCELIIQFPVEQLICVPSDNWDTFQWQCADNYSLPKPSADCIARPGYPLGHWIATNTSQLLNETMHNLIFFYTFDYTQCLSNCALYSKCIAAWYSPNSYSCFLEADISATCADNSIVKNETFTVFIWRNCQQFPPAIEDNIPRRGSCRTIVDNRYMYIYPITCGHPPTNLSNLFQCWQNPIANRGTTFSHNLHCQLNQSFRVYDSYTPPQSSIFRGFSDVPWLRAYTGYQSFWLINASDHNFRPTDQQECDIFDSNLKGPVSGTLKIIKRTEWFTSKSLKRENPYSKTPVKYVIITDTEVPFCNCFSIEACSNIMRRTQLSLQPAFFSIPYSFVVTGDGVCYEARGWDREPAAGAGKYNPNSFVIALCGQYKDTPNVASLASVKQLIQKAVELKKVKKDYILYLYNDIRDREYPYDGLRRVIALWPNYRGNTERDCNPIGNGAVVSVVAMTICSVLLIVMFMHIFACRLWHKQHCSEIRNCRIETMYGNAWKKSTEILTQILMHSFSHFRFAKNYISPLTSSIIWIEDCRLICDRQESVEICDCKTAVFSSLDIRRFQSGLVHVGSLTNLPEVCGCSKTIVFVFERHGEIGREYLLILHLKNVKSFYRFINKLHRNNCVCDHFNLTKYRPSPLYFSNDNNWSEEIKSTQEITARSHDTIREKYAVLSR